MVCNKNRFSTVGALVVRISYWDVGFVFFIFLTKPAWVSAQLVQAWFKSNFDQKVQKNDFQFLIAKKKAKKGQNGAHSDLDCINFEIKNYVKLKFL